MLHGAGRLDRQNGLVTTLAVAIGTYNGARFVGEQLDSILDQSRLPDLIVVADDGSTDDTSAIVADRLETARAAGIRTLAVPPGGRLGVTANFARAIEACDTDLVVLCDQDDVWATGRLDAIVAAFDSVPETVFRHENARLVDAEGHPIGLTLFDALGVGERELSRIRDGDAFSVYLRRNLATGATVTFRRELFDRAAPLPGEWVHDEWLAVVASVTGTVSVDASATIDYRQHGNNVIGIVRPTLRHRLRRMLATSATPQRGARRAGSRARRPDRVADRRRVGHRRSTRQGRVRGRTCCDASDARSAGRADHPRRSGRQVSAFRQPGTPRHAAGPSPHSRALTAAR